MKTKTKKRKRSLTFKRYVFLFCVLAVIASVLSYRFILRGVGEFLVFAQPPQKVDLIVALAGEDIARVLGTVEMYKAGYAGRIFRAREPFPDAYERLIALGGRYVEPRDNFREMLHSLGVGLPAFLTDDRQVESTYHEARVVRDFLRKNSFKSIMLITSRYHSRRAYLTYKLILKDEGVKIISCPTRYDEFDLDRWWKVRTQAKKALYEYERLPFYLLRYGLWRALF